MPGGQKICISNENIVSEATGEKVQGVVGQAD